MREHSKLESSILLSLILVTKIKRKHYDGNKSPLDILKTAISWFVILAPAQGVKNTKRIVL